jgi:hypothetical protein
MRLGTEVFNKEGLKRQAKCYLACINALKLVNTTKKYIYIHKTIHQFYSQNVSSISVESSVESSTYVCSECEWTVLTKGKFEEFTDPFFDKSSVSPIKNVGTEQINI